jgi:hypothetical protein
MATVFRKMLTVKYISSICVTVFSFCHEPTNIKAQMIFKLLNSSNLKLSWSFVTEIRYSLLWIKTLLIC